MKALERRQAIIELLCERRCEKIDNLSFEFGVSRRTIENDIFELSFTYPIYTQKGKYDGGVYIAEDYYLGKQYLSSMQLALLQKLKSTLCSEEEKVIDSIIKKFGKGGNV